MKELSQEIKNDVHKISQGVFKEKDIYSAACRGAFIEGAECALTTPEIYEKAGLSSVEWIPISERLPDTEDLTDGAVWAWSTKLKRECRVNWMWVTVDSHYSHWRKSLTPPTL